MLYSRLGMLAALVLLFACETATPPATKTLVIDPELSAQDQLNFPVSAIGTVEAVEQRHFDLSDLAREKGWQFIERPVSFAGQAELLVQDSQLINVYSSSQPQAAIAVAGYDRLRLKMNTSGLQLEAGCLIDLVIHLHADGAPYAQGHVQRISSTSTTETELEIFTKGLNEVELWLEAQPLEHCAAEQPWAIKLNQPSLHLINDGLPGLTLPINSGQYFYNYNREIDNSSYCSSLNYQLTEGQEAWFSTVPSSRYFSGDADLELRLEANFDYQVWQLKDGQRDKLVQEGRWPRIGSPRVWEVGFHYALQLVDLAKSECAYGKYLREDIRDLLSGDNLVELVKGIIEQDPNRLYLLTDRPISNTLWPAINDHQLLTRLPITTLTLPREDFARNVRTLMDAGVALDAIEEYLPSNFDLQHASFLPITLNHSLLPHHPRLVTQGQTRVAPITLTMDLIGWNPKLLDQLGLEVPNSFEAIELALQQAKSQGLEGLVLHEYSLFNFQQSLLMAQVRPSTTSAIAEQRLCYRQPEVEALWQRLQSWQDQGLLKLVSQSDIFKLVIEDKALAVFNNDGTLTLNSTFYNQGQPFDLAFSTLAGNQGLAPSRPINGLIFPNSGNRQQQQRLLALVNSPIFGHIVGRHPYTWGGRRPAMRLADYQDDNPQNSELIRLMSKTAAPAVLENNPALDAQYARHFISQGMRRVLLEGKSYLEALDELQQGLVDYGGLACR